jgi:hypothetical protein
LSADQGASAQDLNGALRLADSLLRMRDTNCISLYKRALYFAPEEQERGIRLALSRASYEMGDWKTLYKLLWNADLELDSIGRENMVYYLRLKMKAGDFDRVMELGSTYSKLVPRAGGRYLFYGLMAALEAEDPAAMREFAGLCLDAPGREKFETLLRRYEKRKKSPARARLLSLVPGMGQLYAADLRNAANSLLLNAGIGALMYYMWDRSRAVAVYTGIALLPRYYFGGIRNAGRSADLRNNRLKNELRNGVLALFGQ